MKYPQTSVSIWRDHVMTSEKTKKQIVKIILSLVEYFFQNQECRRDIGVSLKSEENLCVK
jgi:hypothetical protein